MIVVFLNLDEVIRIIREEEDPKEALKLRFSLTEPQVVYILDTRLRSLRRLEEMALRKEQDELTKEKAEIEALLASEKRQWQIIAVEVREVKKKFGPETKLGRRRTSFEAAPDVDRLRSRRGDDRARAVDRRRLAEGLDSRAERPGRGSLDRRLQGRRRLKTSFFAETTSKILVLASDGKVFTLDASKMPGGRGQGEPIRLMADIDEGASIVAVWAYAPGAKRLIVASDGYGFVVGEDELLSSTRKGRAVLNVTGQATAALIVPADGDHVAVIGENRKLLVFPACPAQRNGARQRHAAAALQGRRRLRRKSLRHRRRPHLARLGRPHVHRNEARAQRLDRQPRRGRPPAAEGVSQEQPVRGVGAAKRQLRVRYDPCLDVRFPCTVCWHRSQVLAETGGL